MATGRAPLTDSEREYLAGERDDQRKYEARARVNARIEGALAADVTFLAEEHPDLFEQVYRVVRDAK